MGGALIAYASLQGSTARISEAVVEGMRAAGLDASAIALDRLAMMPQRLASAELIGVGTPVYFLREPRFVSQFLAALPELAGRRAFAFCTTGMNRLGETLERVAAALARRGLAVVGAESFAAAMSYPPYRARGLGNPPDLPDQGTLERARAFGMRMAGAEGGQPLSVPSPGPLTRLKARLLSSARFRGLALPGVRLDSERCTGYGSCISRCPFEALERDGDDEIPVIGEACVRCLQCLTSCPRDAIVVDSGVREAVSALLYRLRVH